MEKDVFRSRLEGRTKLKKKKEHLNNKYIFDTKTNEGFSIGKSGIISLCILVLMLISYSIKLKVNTDVYIVLGFICFLFFIILNLLEKETQRAREIFKYD